MYLGIQIFYSFGGSGEGGVSSIPAASAKRCLRLSTSQLVTSGGSFPSASRTLCRAAWSGYTTCWAARFDCHEEGDQGALMGGIRTSGGMEHQANAASGGWIAGHSLFFHHSSQEDQRQAIRHESGPGVRQTGKTTVTGSSLRLPAGQGRRLPVPWCTSPGPGSGHAWHWSSRTSWPAERGPRSRCCARGCGCGR